MSEATCPRCGRAVRDGWCGYCLARCDQPPGESPRPAPPGRPRAVYDRAADIARQATGRDDGPAHDAVRRVVEESERRRE